MYDQQKHRSVSVYEQFDQGHNFRLLGIEGQRKNSSGQTAKMSGVSLSLMAP